MKVQLFALPQSPLTIEGQDYVCTAMPATAALQFMEQHLESINTGKVDLAIIKQVVCKYVSKDNMQITSDSFDIIFARKIGHLQRLFEAVLEFNFPKEDSDSED